ncbi:MAG: hypothetical protein COX92_00970 [Candidatus Nealsonbacteria bacterium CG_4_10_14_0_2_um_filter_40_15]|uniref:Uncharacterized protein n=1 Tax=Candidatus Nealsonbacteria bacterium CG_4_10_14_0_2_um_filter_40_15 TaxID=1974682 RepID=A0A2M7UUN6_9BACT|nr:MAG: hypothetical protein COX92_00970 [Candidatus Nealsonbacteria bacterium CG_4_10_14_0_2_um_filter_40_15]
MQYKVFLFAELSPKNSPAQARARRKKGARGRNSAAPERKLSKVGVGIFFEKSSDFVQDRQHEQSPKGRFFWFSFALVSFGRTR